MIARLGGGLVAALGLALAVLPALTWYSAHVPGGSVTATGLEGAGELWIVPVLGAVALLGGLGLAAAPPRTARESCRWAGPMALVGGALGLIWTLRAGLDPDLVLTIQDRAGSPVADAVGLAAPAYAAPAVAVALTALGGIVSWVGWRP